LPARIMNRFSLALLLLLLATVAHGQSPARAHSTDQNARITEEERALARRALLALKRLDDEVIVYQSLGEFEESGKLSRVSFEAFRTDLREVSAEVDTILARLPESKIKTQLGNALSCYRDGAFWWAKIYQPRVMNLAVLQNSEPTQPPFEAAYLSSIPYTVAINWRQANKHLKRAEQLSR
jgi:hypothetical protein